MSNIWHERQRLLLYGLRGCPTQCDFCGFIPGTPDLLEPEEAGMWACWHCMWRWETTEIVKALTPILGFPVTDESPVKSIAPELEKWLFGHGRLPYREDAALELRAIENALGTYRG